MDNKDELQELKLQLHMPLLFEASHLQAFIRHENKIAGSERFYWSKVRTSRAKTKKWTTNEGQESSLSPVLRFDTTYYFIRVFTIIYGLISCNQRSLLFTAFLNFYNFQSQLIFNISRYRFFFFLSLVLLIPDNYSANEETKLHHI